MYVGCDLRNGIVYLPTLKRTEVGIYITNEPVTTVPVTDRGALRRALQEAMARGNPPTPLPPRDTKALSPLYKYAGVKNEAAYSRGLRSWRISEKGGVWTIFRYGKRSGRGWEADPETLETLQPGSTATDAIERMIALLQANAEE